MTIAFSADVTTCVHNSNGLHWIVCEEIYWVIIDALQRNLGQHNSL